MLPLLQEALEWHRRVLKLEPRNPDALFNTAQVLSSIAEASEDEYSPGGRQGLSANLYGEAVQLLSDCLARQEELHSRILQLPTELPDGGVALSPQQNISPNPSKKETWASIEEPITQSTLMETGIALMENIAAYCSSMENPTSEHLTALELRSQGLVQEKLNLYVEGVDGQTRRDFALARVNLEATFLESYFKVAKKNVKQYDTLVRELLERLKDSVVSFAWLILSNLS